MGYSSDLCNDPDGIDIEKKEDVDINSSDEIVTTPNIENVNFTKKEKYYYKMVDDYFKRLDNTRMTNILDIIEGRSNLSLRIIDSFATQYAKKHKVTYYLNNIDDTVYDTFNVYTSYKAQVKSYKKKYFDPFRRGYKFNYNYDKSDPNKKICTTLGQLNFFKWLDMNDVIKYMSEHIDEICK